MVYWATRETTNIMISTDFISNKNQRKRGQFTYYFRRRNLDLKQVKELTKQSDILLTYVFLFCIRPFHKFSKNIHPHVFCFFVFVIGYSFKAMV